MGWGSRRSQDLQRPLGKSQIQKALPDAVQGGPLGAPSTAPATAPMPIMV